MRKFKALGITLVAIFALSAVGTAVASAATFHSESSPTFLFGEQKTENIFTVTGGTVKCKKATFTGTEVIGTSVATVKVIPAYSECTAIGQAATVEVKECEYEITATTATTGDVKVCPSGGKIIVKRGTECTITVEKNTPSFAVDFKNEGEAKARDVLVTSTAEGITYTSSGGACGASGTNGKYTGSVTVKGFTNAAHTVQQGIWVE